MTRLVLAKSIGVHELDGVVYVAPLPDGPIAVLEGIAALIWQETLAGEREHIVAAVAAATAGPVDEVKDSVTAFVDRLLEWGYLEVG